MNNTVSDRKVQRKTNKQTDQDKQSRQETILKWNNFANISVLTDSQSDLNILKNHKNILNSLQSQFNENYIYSFEDNKKQHFKKRLICLQNQIQGLMRKKIQIKDKNTNRMLDYSCILNQKQNQIVELQKKINNFHERMVRIQQKQIQLENLITYQHLEMKKMQDIINFKNSTIQTEVNISKKLYDKFNFLKNYIKNNKIEIKDEQIQKQNNLQDIGNYQIISKSLEGKKIDETQKLKIQLVSLFRQFQRIITNNNNITVEEVEEILESFLSNFEGSRIKESVLRAIARKKSQESYQRLRQQLGIAVSMMQNQLSRIQKQNSGIKIQLNPKIFEILKQHHINIYKIDNQTVQIERLTERTVEIQVQDARTKHLIHLLSLQMRKIARKYPKIQDQLDPRLNQFFQQELIDIIEVDQMDRLIQIVKYVPQVVRVENIYTYSAQKSKKVQFYLRILIKVLLEQLQKLKLQTKIVLDLDEGIIAMIKSQIMDIVNIDDILKVFRVIPKIVQVEKIVEKVIDHKIQIPQIIVVQKIVEKIIEIERIKQIDKIIYVPLEIPHVICNIIDKIVPIQKIVEKIIQIPQIIQRIVEVKKEIPKIVQVEKIVEKIVEVQKVIQVQKVVQKMVPKVEVVQIIKQKVIPTQKIVEKIVEVPVLVQKIVQKIVQVPQIIEIEKIVEKIVPKIEYQKAKQIQNYVQIRHLVIDRIVQKPITIIQTVQKIVEVPQIVQKIVRVNNTIFKPYEVDVIKQKIIYQDKLIQVEIIKQKPVTLIKQIYKQVEKKVQVPVINEIIITIQQYIEKPIVRTIQSTVIRQVYLRDPLLVHLPKIIEVQKVMNHYIQVPKPIKYIEQKIVEVIKYVDRIKEIKVPIQKIIEKMIEVPKIIQIEKIVQKVVVVPRIIEKIIQIPQIVQKVIPKIIYQQKFKQIQKIIQIPVIQEQIQQIEVIKNVYIEVQRIIQKQKDIIIQVPIYEQKIINNEVIVEKIIQVMKQIPKQIQVNRIIYNTIEIPQIITIQKQIIVPIEIPIPTQTIVQKIIKMTQIVQKVVQVPQIIQKIVVQKVEDIRIEEIVKIQQKVVIETEIKEIVKQVPYIRDNIIEVERIMQKIIPIQSIVQEVVTAQQIIQKVIEKQTIIPKIYEVQKQIDKIIQIPKLIQIERIIPQLINVNHYIQTIVEKIVEVPVVVQQIKQVIKENQKIIQVRTEVQKIKQIDKLVEKTIVVEKFKEVVRNINHFQQIIKIVEKLEYVPLTIISYEEKFIQIPYILQKIVEKIVVMPQIVEVLKYVHSVVESNELGTLIHTDIASNQQRYKILNQNILNNLTKLMKDIQFININNNSNNFNFQNHINIIQTLLMQFKQIKQIPRLIQIPKQKIVQKIVEKQKLIKIPVKDERSLKMQLSLTILVQKLITALKRIKNIYPNCNLQLDEDIKLIFFLELQESSRMVNQDFNQKLKCFSNNISDKFSTLGGWSYQHQLMLNSFLQERFLMANLVKKANLQIEKNKLISMKREKIIQQCQMQLNFMKNCFESIKRIPIDLPQQVQIELEKVYQKYDQFKINSAHQQFYPLAQLQITNKRIQSLIREKNYTINSLQNELLQKKQQVKPICKIKEQQLIRNKLKQQNTKLQQQININKIQHRMINQLQLQIMQQKDTILQLEQQKSNLQSQLINFRQQVSIKQHLDKNRTQIKQSMMTKLNFSKIDLKSSKYDELQDNYHVKMVDSQTSFKQPLYDGETGSKYSEYNIPERQQIYPQRRNKFEQVHRSTLQICSRSPKQQISSSYISPSSTKGGQNYRSKYKIEQENQYLSEFIDEPTVNTWHE